MLAHPPDVPAASSSSTRIPRSTRKSTTAASAMASSSPSTSRSRLAASPVNVNNINSLNAGISVPPLQDLLPRSCVLDGDDADDRILAVAFVILKDHANRAMTIKELGECAYARGLLRTSPSAAGQAIATHFRNHYARHALRPNRILVRSYKLAGGGQDDPVAAALYTAPSSQASNRRGTTVWYFAPSTGLPCPFERIGARPQPPSRSDEPLKRKDPPLGAASVSAENDRKPKIRITLRLPPKHLVPSRPRSRPVVPAKLPFQRYSDSDADNDDGDDEDENHNEDEDDEANHQDQSASDSNDSSDDDDDDDLLDHSIISPIVPIPIPSFQSTILAHCLPPPPPQQPQPFSSFAMDCDPPPDSEDEDDDFHNSMLRCDYNDYRIPKSEPLDFVSIKSEDGPSDPYSIKLESINDTIDFLDTWPYLDSTPVCRPPFADTTDSVKVEDESLLPTDPQPATRLLSPPSSEPALSPSPPLESDRSETPFLKTEEDANPERVLKTPDSLLPDGIGMELDIPEPPPVTKVAELRWEGAPICGPESVTTDDVEVFLCDTSYTECPRPRQSSKLHFRRLPSSASSPILRTNRIASFSSVGSDWVSNLPTFASPLTPAHTGWKNPLDTDQAPVDHLKTQAAPELRPIPEPTRYSDAISRPNVSFSHTITKPSNPPINATMLLDVPVYQCKITKPNVTLMRRMDTDWVNLSTIVQYATYLAAQDKTGILPPPPQADSLPRGYVQVASAHPWIRGAWVPLQIARSVVKNYDLSPWIKRTFLNESLHEKFPDPVPTLHQSLAKLGTPAFGSPFSKPGALSATELLIETEQRTPPVIIPKSCPLTPLDLLPRINFVAHTNMSTVSEPVANRSFITTVSSASSFPQSVHIKHALLGPDHTTEPLRPEEESLLQQFIVTSPAKQECPEAGHSDTIHDPVPDEVASAPSPASSDLTAESDSSRLSSPSPPPLQSRRGTRKTVTQEVGTQPRRSTRTGGRPAKSTTTATPRSIPRKRATASTRVTRSSRILE